MENNIQTGDTIIIKHNLMSELVKYGFNESEQKGFVERFVGTTQKALSVYEDEDNGTNAFWVTVDLCCEVPMSACEKINK